MTTHKKASRYEPSLHDPIPYDAQASVVYDQFKNRGPIVQNVSGDYFITGYTEAISVLRSPHAIPRFEQSQEDSPWNRLAERFFVFLDGADHRDLRRIVSAQFASSQLELEAPRIAKICRQHAKDFSNGVATRGEGDVLNEFAVPCSVEILTQLLQLSEENLSLVLALSARIRSTGSAQLNLDLVGEELHTMSTRLLDDEDSLPMQAIASSNHGLLTKQATVALLLLAGFETSANFAGNIILRMMMAPKLTELLSKQPALVPEAIDETLRLHSPAHIVTRLITQRLNVGGTALPAGCRVSILLHLCNRDPREFCEPDAFILGRRPRLSLAFSHGRHFCLGAGLARLEIQQMIEALAPIWTSMKLSTNNNYAWTAQALGRSLTELIVVPHEGGLSSDD